MASYVTPKKNTAFICYISLVDQSNTKVLKANPTLAAGDFKVSIDGGAFNNLATLPTVTPAAGTAVKVSLSAAEMNGDNIAIACIDAAGAEWCDLFVSIQTTAGQIDQIALVDTVTALTQLTSAVADSVPADGSLPSIAQAVYMLVQFLSERSISGTTMTVKKVDGATTLMTFTLNDATNPTSLTRAT